MTISRPWRPDRRRILAGGAAMLAAPRLAQAADDADVAVVGAGAAGLAAARALLAARRTVTVLEARDRVGGRAHTASVAGVPWDAGALYIHFAERNPWRETARSLGVPLASERFTGFALYEEGKPAPARPERRGAFARLSGLLDGATAAVDDVSMAQFAERADPALLEPARGIARLSLGEEPERVSARDYARLWSGDDDLVPSGYGALVAASARDLPIRLSTTVRRVDWSGRGVRIETDAGTVRARLAIITVPVGVLAAGPLAFTPALPSGFHAALEGIGMGALTKVALAFDRATGSWPGPGDFIDTHRGGVDFEFWPFDRPVVVATLGGDGARELVGAGEAAAIAECLDLLARMVGPHVRDAFKAGQLAGWWSDPFARGSYSIARPGQASARLALAEPVGERLLFAGEATGGAGAAVGAAMTVGGATLAGRRAAAQALAILR